jgi:antitoxin YefM
MIVVNYSEFRKNLKENLDNACDNNEVVIVSRAHNKNIVVISLDEYNSWQETKYLLGNANNQQRLERAVKRGEQGLFETHNLIEE